MYDFILFTPFDRARALGVYKIAKVLRDQGCSVKVIDFLQSFIRDSTPLLLWLQEHVHENTIFGFLAHSWDLQLPMGRKQIVK